MTDVLGRDLLAVYRSGDGRQENLDIVAEQTVGGIDNAVQAVIHRIKTVAGELADLGHPDYGSRHHELIGRPNTEGNRNLVKLYILQALAREPRIEKVLKAERRRRSPARPRDDLTDPALHRRARPRRPRRPVLVRMSYVAEPYPDVADQVLTALTGGVARETHRFYATANAFSTEAADVQPESIRVIGQSGAAFFAFASGRDYTFGRDGLLRFLASDDDATKPAAGATWPDEGTEFYVGYYTVSSDDAPLTDRNVGSLTRTLGEAFARELAVLRKQLELVYRSGFIDTAEGFALDMVVALLGVTRKPRDYAVGSVRFFRDSPAPGRHLHPEPARASRRRSALPVQGGGKPRPVSFVTTSDRTLARGQLSVEAPVRAEEQGARGVVDAGAVGVLDQTVLGISGVANDAPTVFGAAGESDDELRRRAKTVAERAGRATPRALTNALAGRRRAARERHQGGRAADAAGPGVVEVFVAADPTEALAVAVEQSLLDTRAAGIRVEHNLAAFLPALTLAPAAAGELREADVIVSDDTTGDDFRFPLTATVIVYPEDPRVQGAAKDAIQAAVLDAVASYVEASAIGDTLVYNRISADIMAVPGVYDAVLDIGGKRNIVVPEGRRAVIDRGDRHHRDVRGRAAELRLRIAGDADRQRPRGRAQRGAGAA